MSNDRPRRYIDYSYVTLLHAIESPRDGVNKTGFTGKDFAFFVEAGMFCIECRKSGVVIDVPPSQLREARRPKPVKAAELP